MTGLLAFSFAASIDTRSQMAPAQTPVFDAASLKPTPSSSTGEDWDSGGGRVTIKGFTLRKLVQAAYDLKSDAEVVGGPDWLGKRRFDINAKIADQELAAARNSNVDPETSIHLMLQNLLRERFGLRVRSAQREMPVLALVMDIKGARLTPDDYQPHTLSSRNGELTAVATTMQELAVSLSRAREVGQRSVVDHTNMLGKYDFSIHWTPDRGSGVPADAARPGLFTALHEQLGLELKSVKGEVPVIEVIAAELPTFD